MIANLNIQNEKEHKLKYQTFNEVLERRMYERSIKMSSGNKAEKNKDTPRIKGARRNIYTFKD